MVRFNVIFEATTEKMAIQFSSDKELLPIQFEEFIPVDVGTEIYTGPYEVTPKAHQEIILETSNKKMTDNVLVHKVPYYETTNKYGDTIYIADEVI